MLWKNTRIYRNGRNIIDITGFVKTILMLRFFHDLTSNNRYLNMGLHNIQYRNI